MSSNMCLYLAGPEVAAVDPSAVASTLKKYCQIVNVEGVFPAFDVSECEATSTEHTSAIKQANMDLIRSCDAVVANITPFRGLSCDPGTAWAIGFAEALGLPVFLWSMAAETTYLQRYNDLLTNYLIPVPSADARSLRQMANLNHINLAYPAVQDFNLTENLMIAAPTGNRNATETVQPVCQNAEEAISVAAEHLRRSAHADV